MTKKPDWWDGMVERINAIRPEDLPDPPWHLHVSPDAVIGKSRFRGGPYVTVTDNENFLKHIRIDVAQGWTGPRFKTGALQHDLQALKRVLADEQEKRSEQSKPERVGLRTA